VFVADYSNNRVVELSPQARTTTTTAVASSLNPSNYGQSVTFTATVTPGTGTFDNGGTVQFVIDGTNYGSPVSLSVGSATISDSALAASGTAHTVKRLAENNLSVCGYFSAVFSSQHLSLSGQYFGAGLCGHIV